MSQNVFVEVFNKAVGLAIPDRNGYRFVAAKDCFGILEKRCFESIAAIERAAAEIYIGRFLVEAVPGAKTGSRRNLPSKG